MPPSMAQKKIDKFGSVSEFRKYYVSTSAARLLRSGQTVEEVRQALGGSDLPEIDPIVLIKQNLIRKKKGARAAVQSEEKKRIQYLNSQEFKDKMRRIQEERESMSFADWVEKNTGIGRERGGTCIRPDIFLSWNNRACDGCEYYEYCVCDNRRLSDDPKRKANKRR